MPAVTRRPALSGLDALLAAASLPRGPGVRPAGGADPHAELRGLLRPAIAAGATEIFLVEQASSVSASAVRSPGFLPLPALRGEAGRRALASLSAIAGWDDDLGGVQSWDGMPGLSLRSMPTSDGGRLVSVRARPAAAPTSADLAIPAFLAA